MREIWDAGDCRKLPPKDTKRLSYGRETSFNSSIRRSSLFHQFLENFKSHSNACSTLIFSKSTHLLNLKRTDNFTENISDITDGHQNYEKCDCKVRIVIGA